VPLSPVIRTVASLGATFITCAVTEEIALEEPTISSNMDVAKMSSSRRSSVSPVRLSGRNRNFKLDSIKPAVAIVSLLS
jgi:hypothetical protein